MSSTVLHMIKRVESCVRVTEGKAKYRLDTVMVVLYIFLATFFQVLGIPGTVAHKGIHQRFLNLMAVALNSMKSCINKGKFS